MASSMTSCQSSGARVECHLAALDGEQFGADAVLLAPGHVTSMAFARAGLLIL